MRSRTRRRESNLVDQVLAHRPWRVFLSHTSDLRDHPAERSFVAAAEAAVIRAGHAVTDQTYFGASDTGGVEYCTRAVARADVYVGIVGLRYGGLVPGRPGPSYTELEFQVATALRLPRLIFLIRDDAPCLPPASEPAEARILQLRFRARLQETGVIIPLVGSPADLELQLLHSLDELRIESVARATFAAIAQDATGPL